MRQDSASSMTQQEGFITHLKKIIRLRMSNLYFLNIDSVKSVKCTNLNDTLCRYDMCSFNYTHAKSTQHFQIA